MNGVIALQGQVYSSRIVEMVIVEARSSEELTRLSKQSQPAER